MEERKPIEPAGSPGFLENLRHRMNRLMDDFSHPGRGGAEGDFIPRIDVEESESEIAVTAEIPGIEPEDLSVSFLHGMLEIRGEKREERRKGWRGRRTVERRYGFFRRVLSIPPEADTERVRAGFKNGVLTIAFPKKQEALEARRRIEVTEGGRETPLPEEGAGRQEIIKGSRVFPVGDPHAPQGAAQRAEHAWGGAPASYEEGAEPPQPEPPEKRKLLENDQP